MSETIAGVLSVAGAETRAAPLVFDSPHCRVEYPPDFDQAADPARLRKAEDLISPICGPGRRRRAGSRLV